MGELSCSCSFPRTTCPMGCSQNCIACAMARPIVRCPRCGRELEYGYGIRLGAVGAYPFCPADSCDYTEKAQGDRP